jgi:dsRNA-specific ribonuclease
VDKKTADVVESLIGAYLVTGGEKMAARFVIMLNRLYMETVERSPEFLEGVRRKRTVEGDCLISPEPSYWPENAFEASKAFGEDHENYSKDLVEPDPKTQSIIDELQNELEYTFKTPHLCRLALAKKKYTKDPKDNFERLEFLGDAILDYLVVDELYNRRSAALDSGDLTDLKQSITSNNLFGSLAFVMGLPQSMLMKASAAKDHISCMYKLEQFKNLLNKRQRGVPLNPDLKRVLEKANWSSKTANRAGPYSCRKSTFRLLKLTLLFKRIFSTFQNGSATSSSPCSAPSGWTATSVFQKFGTSTNPR